MTRPSHAALVEEVAKAIAHEVYGLGFDVLPPHIAERSRATARVSISLIAARLSDVRPEIVEAVEGEREACAKLADGQADAIKIPRDENGNVDRHNEFTKQLVAMKVVARDIAAAIRARGEEKGNG